MELIRGWHNLRPRHRGCVATIGNFDGVHRGHRAVLARLAQVGQELGLPATLLTFEPHPLEFLRPEAAPPRLTSLRNKLMALRDTGLARVLCLRFDRAFAALEPEEFVQRLLVERLGVRFLLVGDDFRFGRGRRGDFAMLQEAGKANGFAVEQMGTVLVDGERVSSTRVRQALLRGDLEQAERLLGRPYSICGRVIRGDRIGRTLGFPTANISLERTRPALLGIFVVQVRDGDQLRPGVASVGTRPSVGGTRLLLEVHLLDFHGDLYGRHLQVEFLKRLRGEEYFDSLEALTAQIARDADAARDYFAALR